jgi:hypothetical protein
MAMRLSAPSLLLLAFACCMTAVHANVVVTGNPHTCQPASASPSCARALLLDPVRIIPAPAPLQPGTFSHVQRVRYLDPVIPVSAALHPTSICTPR